MGKFKKGLFLGGLVGAGIMWLNTTSKGKGYRDKLVDHAADVYGNVKDQVMASNQWQHMTKQKYVAMVTDAVNKYAVKNGMAKDMKNMIVKLVSNQWKIVKKEIDRKKK